MADDANSPIIVLDCETTGLDYRTERIIEVGAVRLEGETVTATYSSMVKPDVPIRPSSFKVHQISDEMLADAPSEAEVIPELMAFIGDLPFVAHNAIFDYSFINEACKRTLDKRLTNRRVDTFEMYRLVFPEEASHGLSSLLDRYGFPPQVKHRALDDAQCLAWVYPKLKEMYEQKLAWQYSQLPNLPYLVERYLRLQKSVNMLQAEMSDLREVFKLHFAEGGQPITATTGDMMVSSYRRQYEYDEPALKSIIAMAGLENKAYKLNLKAVERLMDRSDVDEDVRRALKGTRQQMTEVKTVNFVKPTEISEKDAAVESGEPIEEVEVS